MKTSDQRPVAESHVHPSGASSSCHCDEDLERLRLCHLAEGHVLSWHNRAVSSGIATRFIWARLGSVTCQKTRFYLGTTRLCHLA